MNLENVLSAIVLALSLVLGVILALLEVGCQSMGPPDVYEAADGSLELPKAELLLLECVDEPKWLLECSPGDVDWSGESCCQEGYCSDPWDSGVGICLHDCVDDSDCEPSDDYGATFCLNGVCVLRCGDPNLAVCPDGQDCVYGGDTVYCWPEG